MRRISGAHPVRDYALWGAGLTFFAMMAIVPLALESIASAGRIIGQERVRRGMGHAVEGIPDLHQVRAGIMRLTESALSLSWTRQVGLLLPMSLYGEGLRRSFLQLSYGRPTKATGWKGRVAVLPVLVAGPLIVVLMVLLAPYVGPRYAAGGWQLLLAVVSAFHFTFLVVGALLAFAYRTVGSAVISRRAALIGAFVTSSFIAGFAQGFLLFLAIPMDWSSLFGGLSVIGTGTAVALWLYAMHVLVLVGYRLALVLDDPLLSSPAGDGAPRRTPLRPSGPGDQAKTQRPPSRTRRSPPA